MQVASQHHEFCIFMVKVKSEKKTFQLKLNGFFFLNCVVKIQSLSSREYAVIVTDNRTFVFGNCWHPWFRRLWGSTYPLNCRSVIHLFCAYILPFSLRVTPPLLQCTFKTLSKYLTLCALAQGAVYRLENIPKTETPAFEPLCSW